MTVRTGDDSAKRLHRPAPVSSAHAVSPAVEALRAFIRSSVEALEHLAGKSNVSVPEWQENQESFEKAKNISRRYKTLQAAQS